MNKDKELYIIGCIPVNVKPTPPPEQKNCTIEQCQICETNIWVSENKRTFRRENTNQFITICFFCAAKIGIEEEKKTGEKMEIRELNVNEEN